MSSTCTVFAESEVVSLIASGAAPEEIAWGVHLAISERIAALAERLGMAPPAVLTGGVAKNPGARKALEDRFRIRFLVPDEPQLTGALGAALIAFERSRSPSLSTSECRPGPSRPSPIVADIGHVGLRLDIKGDLRSDDDFLALG